MKLDLKHNLEAALIASLHVFVGTAAIVSALVIVLPGHALAKTPKVTAASNIQSANAKLDSRVKSKLAQRRAIDKLKFSDSLTTASNPKKSAGNKSLLLAQNSAKPADANTTLNKPVVDNSTPPVFAPSNTAAAGSISTSVQTDKATSDKPWAIESNLEQSSNMRKETDPTAEVGTTLTVIPAYKLTDKLTVSARADVEKQQTGPKETKMADASLALSLKGWTFSETLSTLHILTGVAPTSEKSAKDDKLKGGASLGNRLVWKPTFGGGYSYTLGYRENFHEFNINREGKANIQRVISHRVITETPLFGSKFTLAGDGIFRNSYTYGNTMKDGFAFSADLGYAATETFSVYVGTSNEGSALRAGSTESNIEVFNDKSSVLRAGLTYVL